MTAWLSLDNLLAWMLQVLVLASLAALLPLMLRIRHPRTQLAWCHVALLVCLLLPLLQRWRHPVVVIGRDTPIEFPVRAPEPARTATLPRPDPVAAHRSRDSARRRGAEAVLDARRTLADPAARVIKVMKSRIHLGTRT